MNIDNIISINNIIINKNLYSFDILSIYPFNPIFFMLLAVKSFKIFPKNNVCSFISKYFALNWYIFGELTNKKRLLPI